MFFARYEATQLSSPAVDSEYLLLGLLRENEAALSDILGVRLRAVEVLSDIEVAAALRQKPSDSVDPQLSAECRRILRFASEESERLSSKDIGPEHLVLGFLREEPCQGAMYLRKQGLVLDEARARIAGEQRQRDKQSQAATAQPADSAGVLVLDAETSERLLAFESPTRIPAIGEAILIRASDGKSASYRVKDVVWEFTLASGGGSNREVKVYVERQR